MAQQGDEEPELNLSFDVGSFNAENFNVERFLDRTRHCASLDEIHKDLRVFLQDIQSKMVTLINDDYTDFVKLSTSLHALNDAKQGLSASQAASWGDYDKSFSEGTKVVNLTTQKLEQVKKSRHEQFVQSLQLARATAVKSLLIDLKDVPKFADLVWLERVREHVAMLMTLLFILTGVQSSEIVTRYSTEIFADLKKHLFPFIEFANSSSMKAKSIVLSILVDIQAVHEASEYVSKFICPAPEFEGKADARLVKWIECINAKHLEVTTAVNEAELPDASKSKLQRFYDNCILTTLTNVFMANIRLYLLPINPEVFKKCFQAMNEFVDSFPNKDLYVSHWKTWVEGFQVSAYIRYHTLKTSDKFRKMSDDEMMKIVTDPDDGDTFETCAVFVAIVRVLFDENVVLKNARTLFWEEAFTRFTQYLDWVVQVREYLLSCPELLPIGTPTWLALVVAGRSFFKTVNRFQVLGHEFLTRVAADVDPAQINLMSESLDNCISYAEEQVKRQCDVIELGLNAALFQKISTDIQAVSEVPKVYRWTKHPAPTGPSPYACSVRDFLEEVTKKSVEVGWSVEVIGEIENMALERSLRIFHAKASEVLDSVEQIGSSLLRLKKKQTPTPDGAAVETDEGKMKKQIAYDVKYFKDMIEITKSQVFTEISELLETLLTRAEIYDQ